MSWQKFVEALKTVGCGIGKVFKIFGLVVFDTVVIAVRTFMRTVKSLFVGLFNIVAGIKNFFDLTKGGKGLWRWIVFVFKLPFLLVFSVIKYVLTMTLGTLYNFIESIFMMVRYNTEESKNDGKVEVCELYKENCLENNTAEKSAGQSVLKDFALANIDISNCLTNCASSIKKMNFIQSVQKFFCAIGNWFLMFGSGNTEETIKQYINSLKPKFGSEKFQAEVSTQYNTNNNVNMQEGNKDPNINNNNNIPISTVFGSYEVL